MLGRIKYLQTCILPELPALIGCLHAPALSPRSCRPERDGERGAACSGHRSGHEPRTPALAPGDQAEQAGQADRSDQADEAEHAEQGDHGTRWSEHLVALVVPVCAEGFAETWSGLREEAARAPGMLTVFVLNGPPSDLDQEPVCVPVPATAFHSAPAPTPRRGIEEAGGGLLASDVEEGSWPPLSTVDETRPMKADRIETQNRAFRDALLRASQCRASFLTPHRSASALQVEENATVASQARGSSFAGAAMDGCSFFVVVDGAPVVLLDRGTGARRLQGGVGEARKLGVDMCLALHEAGALRHPWVGSSDADVHLPRGYANQLRAGFHAGSALNGASRLRPSQSPASQPPGAAFFNFWHHPPGPLRASGGIDAAEELQRLDHRSDDPVSEATVLYENHMRYHRLGLLAAGSPHAFHALGSALAVHLDAYASVRGFPKRHAGEDFHLLRKISGRHTIFHVPALCVGIRSRRSTRTPFGTGAAVEALLQRPSEARGATWTHPSAFWALSRFLGIVGDACGEPETQALPPQALGDALSMRFADSILARDDHEIWLCSTPVEPSSEGAPPLDYGDRALLMGLVREDCRALALAWRQRNTPEARRLAACVCFDALRTFQFVHRWEASVAPALPWREAWKSARFLTRVAETSRRDGPSEDIDARVPSPGENEPGSGLVASVSKPKGVGDDPSEELATIRALLFALDVGDGERH